MPRKEPFDAERSIIMERGVQHHFDHAFDIAIRGFQCSDVHAEAAGQRVSDLLGVKPLAVDFAAFQNAGGQGLQHGLLTEIESERLHLTDKPALPVTDGCERFGKAIPIPSECRPVRKFMDVHSPLLLRRLKRGFAA